MLNVVYGVNHASYDPAKDHIVTAASCTTNCLAPSSPSSRRTSASSAAPSPPFTTSPTRRPSWTRPTRRRATCGAREAGSRTSRPRALGSATAIALIFPELKGKLNGLAVRVPLLNGSLTDCVFELARETTAEEVNELMRVAAEGELGRAGIRAAAPRVHRLHQRHQVWHRRRPQHHGRG